MAASLTSTTPRCKLALSVSQNHPRGILPPEGHRRHHQDRASPRNECLHAARNQARRAHALLVVSIPWPGSRVVHCYVEDITERLSLESQLRQSQKMESIGQLAAGVAHDFNNMLTIIQGHAGMLMTRPNMPPQALDSAQAVFFASERAASLTRQLLMFSRKNVMQPKQLDLRDVVANVSKMLHRLLGRNGDA
jgi:signal transduction histidine kinase